MPSSFASRSDKPQKRQRTPLGRSSSLLGAIKTIVTAPLSWFGNPDELANVDGKRKHSPKSSEDEQESHGEEEGSQRSIKRQRRYSPEPSPPSEQQTAGYLDPNLDGLVQQHPAYSGHSSSSLAVPSSSRQQQRQARRSHSPYPTTSYAIANGGLRTQSMDPPNRRAGSFGLSLTPGPLSRDASMEAPPSSSPIQEDGFSPSRTRFRMRTSLTPQPPTSFGLAYTRRDRDTSEPPPLTSLVSQPVFVKAPSGSQLETRSLSREPSVTLGSIAEQRRSSATLSKQHRSLQIAEKTSSDHASDSALHPINATEKVVHGLDIYTTPLLPSRLKNSSTIPEMFKRKRMQPPVLMRGDRDERPRLGMSEKPGAKRKAKDDGKSTKPYSGQGGMKKLLARRRKEEEEEKREAAAAAAEAEEESAASAPPTKVAEEVEIKEPDPVVFNPPEEEAPPARIGGRVQSSLRVGRTRTSRTHPPTVQTRSRNKFSAVYEDDGDDQMQGEEGKAEASTQTIDSAPIPQLFKPPAGFSFAKDTTPIQQDASTAKEPPIAALPFSITAAATTAPAVTPTVESTQLQAPSPKPAPAALAPVAAPAVPAIALVPSSPAQSPSPALSKTTVAEPKTGTAVPNFFANSSYIKNATVQLPSTFSLVPPAPSVEKVPEPTPVPAPAVASEPAPEVTAVRPSPSPFGPVAPVVEKPAEASKEEPVKPAPVAPPTSLFGGPPSTPGASAFFATPPVVAKAPAAAPAPSPFSFGPAATKLDEKPIASLPFSFGTLSKPVEKPAPPAAPSPFAFGVAAAKAPEPAAVPAPSVSPFSFGPTKTDASKDTGSRPASDTSKPPSTSLFGTAPATQSPFSFGVSAPAASTAEPPKPAFSFGTPPATATAATTAPETSKPLFAPSTTPAPVFTFGATVNTGTTATATDNAGAAKTPFSFGSKPGTPTAPVSDKASPFNFAAPSPVLTGPGSMLFGTPSSGSNGADVSSKPFTFGMTTASAARPTTPPKNDNEVFMDESPARGGNNGMDLNGGLKMPTSPLKPSTSATTAPFSFGPSTSSGSTSSPFGQPAAGTSSSSPFSFGPSSSSSSPFGQTSTASPFSFGQKTGEGVKPSTPTPAPFSFGSAPATPVQTSSPFAFGPSSSSTASGGFGSQPSGLGVNGSTTPASPSLFGNPTATPFSFGTPSNTGATVQSSTTNASGVGGAPSAFGFGSQPASPATGNTGLPGATPGANSSPFTFGMGANGTGLASSPSPFGAAMPLPQAGAPLFNMGSAPPPPSMTPGGRPLKKLPSRRAGKR